MELFGDIISWAAIATIAIQFIMRILPNDKIWDFGFSIGKTVTTWGSTKFGVVYTKVEEYFQESFGIFFSGVSSGLNSDDVDGEVVRPEFPTKKDTVRK